MSSSRSQLVVDSAPLVAARIVYALVCRRFLLAALNPTLRDFSTTDTLPYIASRPVNPLELSEIEDDLTTPGSSHAPSPSIQPRELPPSNIQLTEVGDRLQDRVLQLNHGRHSPVGTTKKATRGLSRVARTLFCLSFAEASNAITLVVLNALGILQTRSRQINFSLSLHLLLSLILLVIPLVQCLLLTYRSSDTTPTGTSRISFKSRALVSFVPFGLYCFAFTFIPPYVNTASDSSDWTGGVLPAMLGRVVVLGIVMLAGLSGFGAMRTAWNFMEHLKHEKSQALSNADVNRAEQSLYQIRQELLMKREELARTPSTPSKGWVGRMFSSNQGVEAELQGLEAMEQQMTRSLASMKHRKGRQEFGRTFAGQLYSIAGYGFAAYCTARLVMCLPSIFFSPSSEPRVKGNTNGDWISYFLVSALSRFPSIQIDVAVWSRTISLLLTGVLIMSSLAQILRSVGQIVRLTSRTAGASFLLLGLGQLFSVYVISLLIQIRSTLDDEDGSLLNTLPEFRTFGRLFDVVFLVAAASTAIYRYISLKVV